jgi:ribosomal protein S18 acetylase RimI-like enzyme
MKNIKLFNNGESPELEILIKILQPEDYPAIMTLQKEIHRAAPEDIFVVSTEEEMDTVIHNGSSLGAFHEQKLIGVVAGYSVPDVLEKYSRLMNMALKLEDGYIEFFYCVDSKYRGHGISQKLLGHSIDIERERGTQHIVASVHPENVPSLKILFNSGLTVRYAGKLYGGKPRLLLHLKSFAEKSEFTDSININANDLAAQQKLIKEGFIGAALNTDQGVSIEYRKKR